MILSDAPPAASVRRPALRRQQGVAHRNELAQLVRHDREHTGGVLTRQRSRMAAYERGRRGTEVAPDPSEQKAASADRELWKGNMTSSADRGPSCHRDF